MKFLSFFLSSLWYALGGAFCIEVVGIVGVVGVVGFVSRYVGVVLKIETLRWEN